MNTKIHTITALDAAPRTTPSNYPEPFRSMMNERVKRPLGDLFGLTNFGVNITVVAPGAVSALRHAHSKQNEFVYVVSDTLALYSGDGRSRILGSRGCWGRVLQFASKGDIPNIIRDPLCKLQVILP